MKYIKVLRYTVLSIIISACTKSADTYSDDVPVVQSYLQPGVDLSVKISEKLTFGAGMDIDSLGIEGLDVFLSYNGNDYLLFEDASEAGKYVSIYPSLVLSEEESYGVYFYYNDLKVSSSTSIPLKPINIESSIDVYHTSYLSGNVGPPGGSKPNPITISWENPNDEYHQSFVEFLDTVYDPISSDLDSDEYEDFVKVSSKPTQDDSQELIIVKDFAFFGNYRIVVTRVNEEYVSLYENIGDSSLNLTEPSSNIENGLGIFTGINSDTLYVKIVESDD